jgi:hypothetical protein
MARQESKARGRGKKSRCGNRLSLESIPEDGECLMGLPRWITWTTKAAAGGIQQDKANSPTSGTGAASGRRHLWPTTHRSISVAAAAVSSASQSGEEKGASGGWGSSGDDVDAFGDQRAHSKELLASARDECVIEAIETPGSILAQGKGGGENGEVASVSPTASDTNAPDNPNPERNGDPYRLWMSNQVSHSVGLLVHPLTY